MKFNFKVLAVFFTFLFISCSSDDNSSDDGELIYEVFSVEPLTYIQYDVPQSNPDFSGVSVYAWAVFDQEPDATNYRLTYESTTASNLNFRIIWQNGQPIPSPGAPNPGDVPGYSMGLIGNQYYIRILASGCQGAVGGSCVVGGETPNTLEENLRNIEGEVTVEIVYDGLGFPD